MADIDIIKKIERGIGRELPRVDRIGDTQLGYVMNKKGRVTEIVFIDIPYLHTINAEIEALTQLTSLSITDGNLVDISFLKSLTKLSSLDLSRNNITDISPLRNLKNLTELTLSSNSITDISPIRGLSELETLFIPYNNITDISPLSSLGKLAYLYLPENKIVDISPLQALISLRLLWMWGNQIHDISPLKNLVNLKQIVIYGNQIKELPEWIADFQLKVEYESKSAMGSITVGDNPISSPPVEIVRQGNKAIENYFYQIKKEKGRTEYLFEAKLLVIGEGGSGKTTFRRKIMDVDAEMPQEKDTTLGIEVSQWEYTIDFPQMAELNNISFYVNLWDFGGQKVYQGTHQIFFSPKSFYVLLTDTREERTDFSYWLNTVEQLGGEDSSLIIIINKKFGHELRFDESGYRNRFGSLIKDIIQLNLSNDRSKVLELQEKVKTYLKHLPGIGDPLPPSWVSIRASLSEEKKDYISFDRFREICKSHGLEEASVIRTLSGYFNRIGTFTHYIDDPLLQERIYLNSNWLVKTVYEVLDNEIGKDKKGRLNEEDIKKIWKGNQLHYEVNKLTQLMHNFGLMYHISGTDKYVIPAHLPTVTPYQKWPHEGDGDILKFIYEFDKYMPQGIMSRLIVALNDHIKNHDLVWHRGVNLELNGAFAEIIESYGSTNSFEIRVVGINKIELLAVIRERFAEVLKPFNKLNYKQMVPCVCEECSRSGDPAFHDYNLIQKFRAMNQGSQCSKTGVLVPAQNLLRIIEPPQSLLRIAEPSQSNYSKVSQKATGVTKIKLFLASSSELQTEREQFEIFINRENKRLHKENIFIELVIWEDFIDAMSNTRLQDEYNKAIAESDIFVSLFFTKVGKYTAEEFEKAFGQFKATGRPLVYTFFKDANVSTGQLNKKDINSRFKFEEKLKKLGHFHTSYKSPEDLKLHFKTQLDKILPVLFPTGK